MYAEIEEPGIDPDEIDEIDETDENTDDDQDDDIYEAGDFLTDPE